MQLYRATPMAKYVCMVGAYLRSRTRNWQERGDLVVVASGGAPSR